MSGRARFCGEFSVLKINEYIAEKYSEIHINRGIMKMEEYE